MLEIGDPVVYVSQNNIVYDALIQRVGGEFHIDLEIIESHLTLKNVSYDGSSKPNTWHHVWVTPMITYPKVELVERVQYNVEKDNPKSPNFEIPLPGRNSAYTVAWYWYEWVGTMPLMSQIKAAKKLLEMFEFSIIIRAIRFYALRRYTLNWLSKNPQVIIKEFL